MPNPPFKDAYQNPREDRRDKGFLDHIHQVMEKWVSTRNGQREALDMQVSLGIDQSTGQLLNISIKASVRPKGLIT
jgi:hypothetical protein